MDKKRLLELAGIWVNDDDYTDVPVPAIVAEASSKNSEAQVLRNSIKRHATEMVHWASKSEYYDEDEALKILMDELHKLLKDKESVR